MRTFKWSLFILIELQPNHPFNYPPNGRTIKENSSICEIKKIQIKQRTFPPLEQFFRV